MKPGKVDSTFHFETNYCYLLHVLPFFHICQNFHDNSSNFSTFQFFLKSSPFKPNQIDQNPLITNNKPLYLIVIYLISTFYNQCKRHQQGKNHQHQVQMHHKFPPNISKFLQNHKRFPLNNPFIDDSNRLDL